MHVRVHHIFIILCYFIIISTPIFDGRDDRSNFSAHINTPDTKQSERRCAAVMLTMPGERLVQAELSQIVPPVYTEHPVGSRTLFSFLHDVSRMVVSLSPYLCVCTVRTYIQSLQ